MHATETLAEADRLMVVCNSCRYCEGLCAVFPAMEARRVFTDGDLNYLANLCHSCGACYVDCQFSPPHEFNVNVPQTLAKLRAESFAHYAWPSAFRAFFVRNGLALSILTALSVAGFLIGFAAIDGAGALFAVHSGPGSFYALMPHWIMVVVFGAAFVYALAAIAAAVARFWRDIGEPAEPPTDPRSIWDAIRDAATLRYLDGGGAGCYNKDERPHDHRRISHHFVFYGFLLCFASTCVATLYHYSGFEAPYAWSSIPVLLGTIGGAGLVIGSIGLFVAKRTRDPAMVDQVRRGMDEGFIAMLLLTGLTGLALLVFRGSSAMGVLLALHLGFVFGLFVSMPYGKFVHAAYRFAALVRYSKERRTLAETS